MKVVVAGGTGFLGRALTRALIERGDEVVVLSRREGESPGLRQVVWNARPGEPRPWWEEVDGADAVVNLAGTPVLSGLRWSDAHKQQVLGSRLDATAALRDAIAAAGRRPSVLLNASAVGYYGFRDATPVDESAPAGTDFLAQVVRRWEEATVPVAAMGVRVVLLRIGVVLAKDGGALPRMLLPFRLGVGGPLGSGAQWMPWIHLDDVVGLMLHALDLPTVEGPVNAVAPQGVDNATFSRALGKAMRRPAFMPTPAFAMKLLMGEASSLVLEGQHPVPKKALASGYEFRWPTLDEALGNIF